MGIEQLDEGRALPYAKTEDGYVRIYFYHLQPHTSCLLNAAEAQRLLDSLVVVVPVAKEQRLAALRKQIEELED